jgi:thiol:disulfide interchange protein
MLIFLVVLLLVLLMIEIFVIKDTRKAKGWVVAISVLVIAFVAFVAGVQQVRNETRMLKVQVVNSDGKVVRSTEQTSSNVITVSGVPTGGSVKISEVTDK